MSEQRDNKAYLKLAQLLAITDIQSTLSEKYAELILQKEGNINFQIPVDTLLGSTKSELLGCTILHLAYKENKLQLFNLLLSHGANCNIKNLKGSSVLHQIIEDIYETEAEISKLETTLNNPFVTSILDSVVKSRNSYNPCNDKGITHLHIACIANHAPAIELYLKNKAQVNQFVSKDSPIFPGYGAVHFAARFSNVDIVKMLLQHGAARNVRNAARINPLHMLIKQNIEIVGLLRQNEVENSEQLIIQRRTNEDIIRLLLHRENRGKIDVVDDTNISRLHIACIMESPEIPEDLLGDVTYINRAVNSRSPLFAGNTALHFAALCDVDKVKLLLKKGANIHLLNAKNQTALDLCIERYDIKDIHDIISSQTDWSKNGVPDNGKTLLDLVSSLQTGRDLHSNTCVSKRSKLWPSYDLLHVAVVLSERGCKNDRMVIEKIAPVELYLTQPVIKGGVTPLHLAFRLKKPKVVNYLLTSCQSAVNYVDMDKLSHLHVACAAGVTDAAEKLLLNGAEVDAQVQASFQWFRHPQSMADNSKEVFIPKGSTALHIAVIVGHVETMRLLVDRGADVYAKDEYGMTPIHWLVVSDNPVTPAADVLMSTSRANSFASSTLKECITNTGFSHLHVACFANNVTAVEQLLADGWSNWRVKENSGAVGAKVFPGKIRYAGYLPLHFALEGKNEKIVRMLIEYGAQVLMRNPITNEIPLFEAFNDRGSFCSDVFVSFFKSNSVLQQEIESYISLTMLHFYCCMLDDKAAENLLNNGAADVNKSMSLDSPIWPGFTPLHVLMKFYQVSSRSAETLMELLMYHGADVTMVDSEKNTPLHLAYNLDAITSKKVSILKTLLRSQKNFDINPTNNEGLSHFHIACALGDVVAMEKLLMSNLDVNRPIDYFHTDNESRGCTPLHLVLFNPLNQNVEVPVRLKAVAVLSLFGADVRAEDVLGNTALHLVAKYHPKYVNLLKKIVDAGGDIYAKNTLAQTPFEIMLSSKDVTIAGIKFFLDRGYCANAFNPVTQKGFVAATFFTHSQFQQQRPAFELIVKSCGDVLDEMGRTIIHNVVSTSTPVDSNEFYIQTVEFLAKSVNIDHQDNLGRTALHIAAQFKNHRAVFALLQAGADINIIDENKKTAFVYAFEISPFFEELQRESKKVVRIFSLHVQKLNVCGLDVHKTNHNALMDAIKNYDVDVNVTQCFYDELMQMKEVKVRFSSISLLNLISGTNEQSINSSISRLERNVIDHLFKTIDKTRFYESLGIIRLRCRKWSQNSVAC